MGSDYSDSDSSASSSAGYGKKHKKEKKEKKDKDKKGDKEKKDKHKDKDEKKDKVKKDKDKDKHKHKGDGYSYGLGSSSSSNNAYHNNLTFPSAAHGSYDISGSHNPVSTYGKAPAISPSSFPSLGLTGLPQPQPSAAAAAAMSFGSPPPSGYRIPLDSGDGQPFPSNIQETGPPAAHDLDGSPIFLGSVLFHSAVHPCKIGPHLHPPAQVAYGGGEVGHNGRYDLLPFVPEEMEWVVTGNGRIPEGRRPVEGGYEEDGSKLYHALAEIEGVRVPGKTGEHL